MCIGIILESLGLLPGSAAWVGEMTLLPLSFIVVIFKEYLKGRGKNVKIPPRLQTQAADPGSLEVLMCIVFALPNTSSLWTFSIKQRKRIITTSLSALHHHLKIKMMSMKKPKAVIVGGSIAGVSCAHALIVAGWDVVVIEKTCAPPTSSPTGAGLGLDPQACNYIQSWLRQPELLHDSTLPLTIDQNQATTTIGEKKATWTLTRDEEFNFRAAYWSDLHGLLYGAMPLGVVLWGHVFVSFDVLEDKTRVAVKVKVLQTDEIVEVEGNLLVAADGCLSSIRKCYLPHLKLRYSGYSAWRGVLDFSGNENSDTIMNLRQAYPELGNCLYFDLGPGTHCVFYELENKRINWIWYINQPEPELKGNSLTMKVSSEMIKNMHQEAEKIWVPELARVMKETKEPFINVIYDCDPLEQLFWDNVVLIGDAAHPTTPHGLRSTNMSILDSVALGKCLEKWGSDNLGLALKEFQLIRLPVISKQVLHSRRVGRIKQGLSLPDKKTFDPKVAVEEECRQLQQRNMPFFSDATVQLN